MSIEIKHLADEITKRLMNYNDDVAKEIGRVVDIVAEECNEVIKEHCDFEKRSGEYTKNFAIKDGNVTKHNKSKIWHVKKPHYRLTHLLQNGHATRNGGRTRAFPHINFGTELVNKRMEELSKEAIKKCSKNY